MNASDVWTPRRFPKYKPKHNKFSIWAESYGGHYGPTFARFFSAQNQRIANGSIESTAVPLRLDTVGIVNGCIDILTQMPAYPLMAFNNTYGVEIINEAEYNNALNSFPQCRSLVETCRSLASTNDPHAWGNVTEVNSACADAYNFCFATMWGDVEGRGVSQLLRLSDISTANHRSLIEEHLRHHRPEIGALSAQIHGRLPQFQGDPT